MKFKKGDLITTNKFLTTPILSVEGLYYDSTSEASAYRVRQVIPPYRESALYFESEHLWCLFSKYKYNTLWNDLNA